MNQPHPSSSGGGSSGSSRLLPAGLSNKGTHLVSSQGVTSGQRSLSSSEEELRSTPDYTSGDELDPRNPIHLGQSAHLTQASVYLHHQGGGGVSSLPAEPGGSKGGGPYEGANKTLISANSSSSSMVGVVGVANPPGSGANYHNRYHHQQQGQHGTAPPERRRGYTDRSRTKKTVRFDSDDFGGVEGGIVGAEDEWFSWDQSSAERQGSQDSTTKDSGIDTCSNFTSSEDSNRELVHTKVRL
jgi:hypothetical protein